MGSKEAFSTKTRPVILRLILREPSPKSQVPGLKALGFGFQVSGFRFQVPGLRFQVPGFKFQVLGSPDIEP